MDESSIKIFDDHLHLLNNYLQKKNYNEEIRWFDTRISKYILSTICTCVKYID